VAGYLQSPSPNQLKQKIKHLVQEIQTFQNNKFWEDKNESKNVKNMRAILQKAVEEFLACSIPEYYTVRLNQVEELENLMYKLSRAKHYGRNKWMRQS
jgi:hypothetical protein